MISDIQLEVMKLEVDRVEEGHTGCHILNLNSNPLSFCDACS